MTRIVPQSLLILLLGTLVGLAANALSPRGLSLTRDYFGGANAKLDGDRRAVHAGTKPAAPATAQLRPPAPATSAPVQDVAPLRSKRGFPLATQEQVVRWFHDPTYAEQRIIFVDARDDARYEAGHIPGAYPFDHYHPERHVAALLAVSPLAERMVVYCHGGDCEDSELAVQDLIALGLPAAKLVIYGGGITEWTARHLPLETGPARPP